MMNRTQLQALSVASKAAKAALIAAGWTEIMSMMSDTPGTRYGTLFTKDGQEFWLNKDTVNNLPI